MSTPNLNYQSNEFAGLSFSKVIETLKSRGWVVYFETIAQKRPVQVWDSIYSELMDDPSQVEWVFSTWSDVYGTIDGSDYAYQIPPGMVGVQISDGSNILNLGRYPERDRIEYSLSWYNTLDTSAGWKIGRQLMMTLLGSVSFGIAPIAVNAFESANPSPVIRPVDLTVPVEARDDLAPVDEMIPTPTTIPGGMVDETTPEPAESAKLSLWPLALVALALFS